MSLGLSDLSVKDMRQIPYGQRYTTMAQIDLVRGDISRDRTIVVDALRPESVFDAQETALWIQSLLRRIHAEVRQNHVE